jgi:hypothetical protein
MACERYLNAINEHVEGTLGPLRRAELELHLETCDACAALVADLREITRAAQSLDRLQPPDRVWTHVAGQLRQEGRVVARPGRILRHRSYTTIALAAALVLAVGASLMLLAPRDRGAAGPAAPPPAAHAEPAGNPPADEPVQSGTGIATELALTERHFQNVLEEAKKSGNAVDPETVAVLQENFLVMTDAIERSRKALASDPQNAAARDSLYDVLKQKIQFLQDTIVLMNYMRQGDAAGAAQIVEGGKS